LTAPTLGSVCPVGVLASCLQNRQVDEDGEGIGLHKVRQPHLEIKRTQLEHPCIFVIVNEKTIRRLPPLITARFLKGRKFLLEKYFPELPCCSETAYLFVFLH